MNHYELMVLFSSTLTDDEEKAQVLQTEELLKREKANMIMVDHWGKRKLAYPIKRQRQGFYEWFYFEMEPGRIAEIDRKLKMSETVLRFMIIRMEKIQTQNILKEAARRQEAAQAPAAAEAQPPAVATAPAAEEQPDEPTAEAPPENKIEA